MGGWLGRRGGEHRAYGAGKLTPFLAYPRSLFNCILLSNFPRGAIDRDTRKGVRLRLISDSPRRLLFSASISFALFLPISLVRQTRSFASLRPPHPTYPHQPLFLESVGCTRLTVVGPPTLRGLFKTARSRYVSQ